MGLNTIGLIEENNWSPNTNQPSTWIAENSLSVGPMKSKIEVDKEWAVYLLLVEPTSCLILLKKKGTTTYHPLKRDKSSWSTIFKLLQHLQLISVLHSTGNHEFWYCSRSKLLHNSSKIIGSCQDAWEMGKCDRKPITMPILVPKGLRD